MIRFLISLIILNILIVVSPAAETRKSTILEDGFLLAQIEGTAHLHKKTGAWRFSPENDFHTVHFTIPAQTEFTILPCRGLEKIVRYADQKNSISIRLRAIATQYKNLNYLFILDVVPIQRMKVLQKEKPKPIPTPAISDPNDFSSVMPASILERLKPKQKTDFKKMWQVVSGTENRVLVSRTGRFQTQGKILFTLDGFGLNRGARQFELLPCRTLQEVEKDLKKAFGRRRYEVSGVVTTFQGRTFLLLQRARRTFTNGNLSP